MTIKNDPNKLSEEQLDRIRYRNKHRYYSHSDVVALLSQVDALTVENEKARKAFSALNNDVCRTLGSALGYQDEYGQDASGEHVAESLADEAAARIVKDRKLLDELREQIDKYCKEWESFCPYCEESWCIMGDATDGESRVEHDRICEKHPMRVYERLCKRLSTALSELQAAKEYSGERWVGRLYEAGKAAFAAINEMSECDIVAEEDCSSRPSFSERNRRRCESPEGFNHGLHSWSLSDWMTALTGEVGEAANIVKKLNRCRDGMPGNDESETELRASLSDEIADVAIYLDLFAQAAGFDLEAIREAKFVETSKKIGYVEEGGIARRQKTAE